MIRIRHVNSSRPFFCRTRFEFSPRFPPRPFIRRSDMFRIGSRAHRVHSSRNAAKFSTSSISSTHILSIPFQFFNSTCQKLHFHSSSVAYSSNFSIDLSPISSHMLPDEVHSTSSSSADFRHLLLTRHGYSSLVRND
jgi:hypothetical protein